jgi:hypothetical protein
MSISDYNVDAVKSFYEGFATKSLGDYLTLVNVNRIFCYPQIASSDPCLQSLFSISSRNLFDIIKEIGKCYLDKKLNLIEAYNAYKHGYRLLFSKDMQNDIDTVLF